jgi:hypothetical protein
MAINIQKNLEGKLKLTGSALGDTFYDFVVPTVQLTAVNNKLSDKVLEEIYIICDSTAGIVNINLPKISDFKNFWNVKIYITKIAGANAVNVYPFNNEVIVNTLNGYTSKVVNTYDSYHLHIVEQNTWMALYSPNLD